MTLLEVFEDDGEQTTDEAGGRIHSFVADDLSLEEKPSGNSDD